MSAKKAFVFDTNFILENINLAEVVNNIPDEYTIYVTQVSINERISQKYLASKRKYDNLAALAKEYKGIAKIEVRTPFNTASKRDREFTQKGYVDLFGENIIPYNQIESLFQQVLDRVYKKIPPFLSADNASDKGFKDTLIWLSLLDYFKENGEAEVVFVTNDKGFLNNAEVLSQEFHEVTGKEISIKENSFYNALLCPSEAAKAGSVIAHPLPDITQLRTRINDAIYALCGVAVEDYWGQPEWNRTFTLTQKFEATYIELVFLHLHDLLAANIFETSLRASMLFELNDHVVDINPVPMHALEEALSVFEEVQRALPEFLDQFYTTATSILNSNYVEQQKLDDDIPF